MRYQPIIIPRPNGLYEAAVACGSDVQRIGRQFPSYDAADYAARYLIRLKLRNAGLDRLLGDLQTTNTEGISHV